MSFQIKPTDIKVSVLSSVQDGVRYVGCKLEHLPTGVSMTCVIFKDYMTNRELAHEHLMEALHEHYLKEGKI